MMRNRIILFLVLSAAVMAVGLFVRRGDDAPRPPNILLITMDTLRADRLHCYGNGRVRTPTIDALAKRGVLFERAFASVPITLPSHTTIMTGLYPHQHGVRDNGVYRLDPSLVTMAETLRDRGYETGAFVSAFVLDRRFRINQGFDHYDDEMAAPLRNDAPFADTAALPEHAQRWIATWQQPYQRRAEDTVQRALEWLADRDGDRPFFCWVHLFDPHTPYQPPPPWADAYSAGYTGEMDGTIETFNEKAPVVPGEFRVEDIEQMIALYDGEVSYADEWVGKIVQAVDARDDRTAIIFTADHGEAFGEHGVFWEHMDGIYVENVHIPLILVNAGGGAPGTRRGDLVGCVDILPTVRELIGAGPDERLPGHSLLDDTRVRAPGDAIYTETRCAISAIPSDIEFRGVRTPVWSLVVQFQKPDAVRAAALFRSGSDPTEHHNQFEAAPAESQRAVELLKHLIGLGRGDDAAPESFWAMDDDDARADPLRSLGYAE